MNNAKYDLIIIGGGPAGLSAAIAAKENGINNLLILERDDKLGGILNQCIHNGFGLHTFKEELTGPEYADRYIQKALEMEIPYETESMVMDISTTILDESDNSESLSDTTKWKAVTAYSSIYGMQILYAKAVILAMGCRERPRGALNIPGYRPSGIFSAGTAQKLVNIDGFMPGREVVILGSGDIGLIMARRMTLEGAKVKLVAEVMPYSGGLKRNIVQCLDDFGIPLKLSHTVIQIHGKKRVEGVTVAEVGPDRKPIAGTEEFIKCDTLLLSVGLIPENELTRKLDIDMNRVTSGPVVNERLETSMDGVFACGNVLHVHDLVDYVSEEAAMAGKCAAAYLQSCMSKVGSASEGKFASEGVDAKNSGAGADGERTGEITVLAESGVRYTVPSRINGGGIPEMLPIRFRVGNVYRDSFISMYIDGERVIHKKKTIIAPGEMETVMLARKMLENKGEVSKITIKIEKE